MIKSIKRFKKSLIVSLLAILLLGSYFTFFTGHAAYAEEFVINFGGSAVLKEGVTYQYLATDTVSGLTVPINPGEVESWEVAVNGQTFANAGTLEADGLHLPALNGVSRTVANIERTNPGHIVWRNSAGMTWQTQGEGTGNYVFPGGCVDGSGVTQCPGVFPSDLPDELENYGRAVTTDHNVIPPTFFYLDPVKIGTEGALTIDVSRVKPSSIEIIKDKSDTLTNGVDLLAAGPGNSGYGMVQVAKYLTAEYNQELDDYELIEPPDVVLVDKAQGRNYAMEVLAYWEGVTYEYTGKVKVTYKTTPDELPDLVPVSLTTSGAVQLGETKTFTYQFKNTGKKINNQPFTVYVQNRNTGGMAGQAVFHSIDSNQTLTGTFTYTAFSPQTVKFRLIVDYKGDIEEQPPNGELNNTADYEFPVNIGIDGDFVLVPSAIDYTDDFQVKPIDFDIPTGCTYKYHQYRFIQNGVTWTTAHVNGQTVNTNFAYPNYPDNLSVGTSMVALQIYTSCGDSGWIHDKPLVVNESDEPNTPPLFRAGFFLENNRTGTEPVSQVILGSQVNLRIIQDPASNPPSPYDEERDYPITWSWDFIGSSSSWIQGLPAKYGFDNREDHFYNITADEAGNYAIRVTGTDRRGESSTRTVFLDVVPPNPIPNATCPSPVKSGRPVDPAKFSSAGSFSPAGYTINHSRDEWVNKLPAYTNLTGADITVQASLWVYDNAGLRSLFADTCDIVVQPDKPPVGKLDVPPLGLRGQTYQLFNKSFSPDGDVLVSAAYRYKYDAANNGYDDDAWQSLAGTMTGSGFTPGRVGKYLFDVYVCEDYGMCAYASATQTISLLVLDTINLGPSVSFDIFGKNEQPEINVPVTFTAQAMMGWPLYEVNTNTPLKNRIFGWTNRNGVLSAGLGKGMERKYDVSSQYDPGMGPDIYRPYFTAYADNGFGANRISPYKGIATLDTQRSQPVLIPSFDSSGNITGLTPAKFGSMVRTNKTLLIFDTVDYNGYSSMLYGYNLSKIPKYKGEMVNTGTFGSSFKHQWPDIGSNPYDYIIRGGGGADLQITYQVPIYANYPTAQANEAKFMQGDFSGARAFNTETVTFSSSFGFEVAGENIYKLVGGYKTLAYYDYYEDEVDGEGCGCFLQSAYKTTYPIGVMVYDAYTGALKATNIHNPDLTSMSGSPFLETPKQSSRYTLFDKGDNLVLLSAPSDNYGGDYTINQLEIDPRGNTVRQNTITFPAAVEGAASCMFKGPTGLYKGVDGEYFSFIFKYCKTASQTNYTVSAYYAFKADANLNLAWMTQLRGKNYRRDVGVFEPNWESKQVAAYNPVTNQLITRSYNQTYCNGCTTPTVTDFQELLDGATGALSAWGGTPISDMGSAFTIRPDGSYGPISGPSTITDDSGTNQSWGSGTYVSKRTDLGFSDQEKMSRLVDGNYIADGVYLGIYQTWQETVTGGGGQALDTPNRYMYLAAGTPNPNIVRSGFQLGQFMSGTAYDDAELSFAVNLHHPNIDTGLAGFSFRMQDPTNRYALEMDATTLYMSRYIGGGRTVLQSIPYPFQPATDYAFKVSMSGNRIDVSFGGVPYLSVTDGTFASGKVGPFTTKSLVDFKGVTLKGIPKQNIEWLTQYAIWESGTAWAEAKYENIAYTDPENDPMAGAFKWSVAHTPKFLNNQGVSTMNGQTFAGLQLYFDKVGDYWITLQARDDPNPSYPSPSNVFDSYRKDSNAFAKRLVVHRRPVTVLSAWANVDGTIGYSDGSYDPDRWISASYYSPPDTTGIDYGATRGVMERLYYYVTPSGQYVESKLTRPAELGTYEVGLSVRDEYGAWSYPVSTTVTVGTIPPANDRPTVALTYPPGTEASPTLIYTTRPTVTWNQFDTPGTVFQGYHVKVSDASGAVVAESGESPQWTTSNSAAWALPVDLPIGTKLQVQVRASDGETWSDWSNVGWMIASSPPAAVLTYPNGTSAAGANLIQDNRRPTIAWNQYDPDLIYGAVFQQYHVQIRKEDGTLVYDYAAAQWTQATSQSMAVTVDLSTGIPLQVQVRVFDGSAWSVWSNIGWLRINMTPAAEVTYPSGTQVAPTIDGPEPTIVWNQTDPDPGTVFLKYQLLVVDEANTTVVYDSGERSQLTTATTNSHRVERALPAGQKLRVRARVFDGYVWSAWSADKWLFTNRPPVADFDWSPKPIWEGDTVYLDNLSSDPDGNALTSAWEIRLPNGNMHTFGTTDVTEHFADPGLYTVTLTVSDGFAESRATKVLEASPLTIRSEVEHTPEWRTIHENKGHNVATVPKDFYSGEVFVVRTASSPAPVSEAKAWIDTVGIDGGSLAVEVVLTVSPDDATRFEGRLYDDRFMSPEEGIPVGVLPIHFQIRYANGVVKREDVPVMIIGNANDAVEVHRRQ